MNNNDLLEKIYVWRGAKKVKPIWTFKLTHDTEIHTVEGPVKASAGDILCHGDGTEDL